MIFGITSCATRVTAGRLCDIRAIKPVNVFQVGALIVSVAVLMFGGPSTYVPFVVISVFYGIGDGISLTVGNLLLLTTVEPKRRASAFGLANMLISVSVATGAPLAGTYTRLQCSLILKFSSCFSTS